MTEPIYSFVKGKGWVPSVGYVITMKCGTLVRLENRAPNVGEYYDCADPNQRPYYNSDGSPDWMTWMPAFARTRYDGLCFCETDTERYRWNHTHCIVAVPL
jgi:hypothetical protein